MSTDQQRLASLGLATCVVGSIYGLIRGPAFAAGGNFYQASHLLGLLVVAAWVWMVATGIVLFRAEGHQRI